MAISKRVRFEVFKRDSFTCQYCGAKAPDVVLQVDHIEPQSLGGGSEILNLVISCAECNGGKSNVRLSDGAVIEKKREQLEVLQERREQLEMLMEWQHGLIDLEGEQIERASKFLAGLFHGYTLSSSGKTFLGKLIRKFGLSEVLESIRIAASQYLRYNKDGIPSADSVELACQKLGGICTVRKRERENPDYAQINYIRAILRRRTNDADRYNLAGIIRDAIEFGLSADSLTKAATSCRSLWGFFDQIDKLKAEAQQRKDPA